MKLYKVAFYDTDATVFYPETWVINCSETTKEAIVNFLEKVLLLQDMVDISNLEVDFKEITEEEYQKNYSYMTPIVTL